MPGYYDVLKKERQKRGYTQAEMAKLLGLSRSAYSLYESGKREPKIEVLQKIADALNISMNELTGYKYQGKIHMSDGSIKDFYAPDSPNEELTFKDKREIAHDLSELMEKFKEGESGALFFNGEEIEPESVDLLRDSLELALRRLKVINKEKYTPKKYRRAYKTDTPEE